MNCSMGNYEFVGNVFFQATLSSKILQCCGVGGAELVTREGFRRSCGELEHLSGLCGLEDRGYCTYSDYPCL